MQSFDFQSLLFQGDLLIIFLLATAIFFSIKKKEFSCLIFGLVFLGSIGLRHYLTSSLSRLPIDEMRFWWFQSFIYLFFAAFCFSFLVHAVLFIKTNKLVIWIYRLMLVNVFCYLTMHLQKNELGITDPNWTHTVYTAVVVPVNYIIASLLVVAAIGNKKNVTHS